MKFRRWVEMRFRDLAVLFLVGLVFNFCIAFYQLAPGYMDADYYYAGGLRIASGQGFTESYLWNYLDNPQSLPHPSHAYWYPLASILAAAGMFITGQKVFWAARLGFILVAALVPPITALLSFQITSQRSLALTAGALAIFCGYHAPFLPTTDNFGLFMLLGGLFFILLSRKEKIAPFFLGLVAGLMNLARVDGIIWLALGLMTLFFLWKKIEARPGFSALLLSSLFLVLGYSLVMAPWIIRNLSIWGTPLTPAGSNVLWMNRYDDTFAWSPSRINLQNWLNSGWQSALESRLNAIKLNSINTVAAQFAFLLFPFSIMGIWALRRDFRIRLAVVAWVILFIVMSIIFPFAGSRGSFFHASAAIQTVWFTAAVVGVDVLVSKLRLKGRISTNIRQVFRIALVFAMAIITVYLAYIAIKEKDWNQFQRNYLRVEKMIVMNGAVPSDVIIVANSPAYFAETGRSAIIVPDENLDSVRQLAQKFDARFLVLEKSFYPDPLIPVFNQPENQPGLTYLGEFENVRVFRINPR